MHVRIVSLGPVFCYCGERGVMVIASGCDPDICRFESGRSHHALYRGLVEWSMAYDWKSYVPLKGTRSSNLLPSSIFRDSLIGRTPDSGSGDEGSSPSLGTKLHSRVYDAGIRSLTLIQRLVGSIPTLGTNFSIIYCSVLYTFGTSTYRSSCFEQSLFVL